MTELVLLVRDIGVGWVKLTAESVRATGCAVGVVGTDLAPADAAILDPVLDVRLVADPTDPAQIVEAVRSLSDDWDVTALLSSSDGVVAPAAAAAEKLGIGRAPAAAFALTRDKYAARRAMRAAGLPTPAFALISDAAQAAEVAAEVGLPAVIKPISGTGGHLVEPVGTVAELAAAHERLTGRLLATPQLRHLYAAELSGVDPRRTFLVEAMLRGPEYCVDVIVRDGEIELLPIVHKFLLDERFFERGFVCPPFDLDPGRAALIDTCVAEAVRVLGLDNTVAHVEVIDDAVAGPTIVEVNAGRPGGQVLSVLYSLHTGVNTGAELVSLARGLPSPRGVPRLPIPLASLTLFPERAGRLHAVHGLTELADLPDVINVIDTVRPGDLISADYEVFAVNLVCAGFLEVEDLLDTYRQAQSLIRFDITPE